MVEGTDQSGPDQRIAILGGGNLGRALANGWTGAGLCSPQAIHITRRRPGGIPELEARGFQVGVDNAAAVEAARTVVLAVQPQQVTGVLSEIGSALQPDRHMLISVVSGVAIAAIKDHLAADVPVVRAMPNTAVGIGESMTCLATDGGGGAARSRAEALFEAVGSTLWIDEEMMVPATALCACGVAFFLRSVRAASQGGIEIGFHPEEALLLAAQTARGAAALLLERESHPESEIDRVTTPRGCTIAGLNEMEHRGFSSAMIRGIVLSARKAGGLFSDDAT
jgi:pyrroline-5-carboxylate reductase